jgi:hypothetical protein
MFGDGFEQATILRTGHDGLTRVVVRSSWSDRESILVEASKAEVVVLRRWADFHETALGFPPSWTPPTSARTATHNRHIRDPQV